MTPRKQARTTTSVARMRKLLALGDRRITAALLKNPKLPKKLRKAIAKLDAPAQGKSKQDAAKGAGKRKDKAKSKSKSKAKSTSKTKSKHKAKKQDKARKHDKHGRKRHAEAAAASAAAAPFDPDFDLHPVQIEVVDETAAGSVPDDLREPLSMGTAALAPERPIDESPAPAPVMASVVPVVIAKATRPPALKPQKSKTADQPVDQSDAKPSTQAAKSRMATVTSIAPAAALVSAGDVSSEPTLQGSLDRVLAAFKKEAAGAGKAMGPGTPGEIVNAFLWVSREARTSGGDKAQYTGDWIIFTEYRLCLGRRSRFLRRGEYSVLSHAQVVTVDVDVASFPDSKEPLQRPYTFVSLKFNLVDGTSILRHIYVDRTPLVNSPALTRVRERLTRIERLGWPLVLGRSWDDLPVPEVEDDDDDEVSSQAH